MTLPRPYKHITLFLDLINELDGWNSAYVHSVRHIGIGDSKLAEYFSCKIEANRETYARQARHQYNVAATFLDKRIDNSNWMLVAMVVMKLMAVWWVMDEIYDCGGDLEVCEMADSGGDDDVNGQ
eukprot:TRINITY_DN6284_c0_g1_i1.p1 TRINITY_DN6284_c0_g1~~TRINITY_DN6284_c0_g1_i1.p1  ORF type:complete len:125 (+),score=17.61 TRINITY_DN6284_c0_g1_i1:168-542(+)